MITFIEDRRTASVILAQLIEHTSPEFLDAHFPMGWSHDQIADAILRRHLADVLTEESQRGIDEGHEGSSQETEKEEDSGRAERQALHRDLSER